jgi:DNA-binding IclR family transcriptional regulator
MENDKIRVISRAFSILVYMAHEKRPMGISEIAAAVSLPKATVYRILDSLEGERAVLNRGGEYELGPVTLLLADAYRRQVGFAESARPHLLDLRNETKETVHLFVYERGEFYYLDKIESPYQVRMHSRVGGRASLFRLSAGKALLARLTPRELRELSEPIPAGVAAEFPEILSKGFAVDNEQNEHGLRCVGAAIFDEQGRPRGAVSLSAPVYRFSLDLVNSYGMLVKRTADAIGESLVRLEQCV